MMQRTDTDNVVRAVCACGYTATDPTTLDLWNGYGDHENSDGSERHAVSVWTLTDGSLVVANDEADQRIQGQRELITMQQTALTSIRRVIREAALTPSYKISDILKDVPGV